MSYCYHCFRDRAEGTGPCPHCGYDPAADQGKYPFALPHGSILAGKYITGRVLGQGGFGITYLALDNSLQARVAIKEFMPDSMAVRTAGTPRITVYTGQRQENFQYGMERFLDEAKVLAKFQENPNIVGVRSYFEENGTAYFVMEYIEGVSFKSYIQEHGGSIPWEDAVRILVPIMDALSAVHKEGIIHRDVTPDNIFIPSGGGVKLLDFGSARYSLGDKSRSLDVVLKAGYAPKEQYTRRGRQGPYTDVYSLAACFYSAVTGYLPPESLDRADEDDLVLPSTRGIRIPQAVEDVILRGLEVQPADRYQSMEEFRSALDQAVTESAEEAEAGPEGLRSAPEGLETAPEEPHSGLEADRNNLPKDADIQFEPGPEKAAGYTWEKTPPVQKERRPLSKAAKGGLVVGCCVFLLLCLAAGGLFTRTHSSNSSQDETGNLAAMTDNLSAGDIFVQSHTSEAMVVVVPSGSEIEGFEDLFGKLIAISDMSAQYPGAYTGSIPDAISLYGEENLLVFDEGELGAYSCLMEGMADAAIMNCGSVRGLFFDADGSLIPEVRILDAEWTLKSASIGKPEEPRAEPTLDPSEKPDSAPVAVSKPEPAAVPEAGEPQSADNAGGKTENPPVQDSNPLDKKPSQEDLQAAANSYEENREWENAAKQYRLMNTYGYIDSSTLAKKLVALGDCASNARESSKDANATSAFELYQEADRLGNMQAATNIGWCYDGGIGVERDESQAVPYFEKAAKAGNKDGMHALGFYYVNGYGGFEENLDLGVQWLTKSFEAGNAYSAYTMGIYLQTEGREAKRTKQGSIAEAKKKISLGFQWYLKGAQAGDAFCMEAVGDCYRMGADWGTEKDVEQAIYWLEKYLDVCSPPPWNIEEIQKHLETLYSERDA